MTPEQGKDIREQKAILIWTHIGDNHGNSPLERRASTGRTKDALKLD
jgi:hypothetical protein